ncbi:transglutaminase-like domain-containing protein [Paracoccus aerodenitrificans]|uniref:transglutaminase-like domain-containing protein n=1 Tax=Paracoccus aerodenitrificans TaxID=3017781 RepID=UPI0022F09039|nr:transglutaminase family protein [Paracoccus aerodenitrificans]WBU65275.1 transglutaminase family protein [Paracoccus aerodenitrificans]
MFIRYGYDIEIESDGPLSLLLQMSVRPERQLDLRGTEEFSTTPEVPFSTFVDDFGNFSRRLGTPAGRFLMRQTAIIADSGLPEPEMPDAQELPVEALPDDVLQFLMPSRYCDSDLLMQPAWDLFGTVSPGWPRVQAVMDWVHNHITFNYQDADPTRTARDAFREGKGVCRDFAHLAIAFCRALNIPARYVNGYLGDFGVPVPPDPMDFAASVQVYLSGRWWNFDPRNNQRRIGRLPVGYGRDATDVPLFSSFGQHQLLNFTVIAEEVDENGRLIGQKQSA